MLLADANQQQLAIGMERWEHPRPNGVAPPHRNWRVEMRNIILAALLFGFTVAAHADENKSSGTAKGAAAGAVVGHNVGSGHAVAGAATGAAIAHHESKKAEETKQQ
jgi:hypothetical protein